MHDEDASEKLSEEIGEFNSDTRKLGPFARAEVDAILPSGGGKRSIAASKSPRRSR